MPPTTKPDPRAAALAECTSEECELIQEILEAFADEDDEDGGDFGVDVTGEGVSVAREIVARMRTAENLAEDKPCA